MTELQRLDPGDDCCSLVRVTWLPCRVRVNYPSGVETLRLRVNGTLVVRCSRKDVLSVMTDECDHSVITGRNERSEMVSETRRRLLVD